MLLRFIPHLSQSDDPVRRAAEWHCRDIGVA